MRRPPRKLSVIAAALAALVAAGAAGAVIRSTVFTITPGNWARLTATGLYCRNTLAVNGLGRILVCDSSTGPGGRAVVGSYYFTINQRGVEVSRVVGGTRGVRIRYFANPQTPGH
jgi:hypothetical protein